MREAVEHRLVDAGLFELVEVGHVRTTATVPGHHGVVEAAVPRRHGLCRIVRELNVTLGFGHRHVVGVDHAPHALAHHVEVVQLGVDEALWVKGGRVARGEPLGDHQLGMGLDDVVLLQEGLLGQLPVDRQSEGLPPLGAHGLDLPGVEDAGEGLDALARWRCGVVEVDPRTAAPDLTAHRDQVDVRALEVVL